MCHEKFRDFNGGLSDEDSEKLTFQSSSAPLDGPVTEVWTKSVDFTFLVEMSTFCERTEVDIADELSDPPPPHKYHFIEKSADLKRSRRDKIFGKTCKF